MQQRVSNSKQHHRAKKREKGYLNTGCSKFTRRILAQACPLYPTDYTPVLLSGDLHQYHLLVNEVHGRWRLCGFFDFDDARIGFHEY